MITVYHVTPDSNLPSIKQQGLIPQLGPNASELGEQHPAIWLFPTRDDAVTAVETWLGDQFGEDTPASLLTLKVPDKMIKDSDIGYEKICYDAIPAKFIQEIEEIWWKQKWLIRNLNNSLKKKLLATLITK